MAQSKLYFKLKQTIIFPFMVLVLTEIVQGKDDCRIVKYEPQMVGRSLLNHTIISVVIDSMEICELRCYLEHDCVSINFGAEDDGANRCELSDSDHIVHPGDLKNREGFIYRSVENFCTSNPCSSNGRCQTGFGDKGYRCICSTGYTGEHCSTAILGHVKEKPGNSCKHILDNGSSKKNGEYWIDLGDSGDPLKVYCDMTTDGGRSKGWDDSICGETKSRLYGQLVC
ncbi:uncharacterized protein LOC111340319 isoform X1 [Stylophora pistillata]|uniref:uncharacterized protein LOC111340319 isoform X1 n=2 Tax=Stylophora pistillata TaxID=50429 RepID=UPI000C056C43|nr:uncharacterized protein LOC111340319 isoform X1 [Stylophora pistillata]